MRGDMAEPQLSPGGERHILVVDDDPDFADALANLLRLENYRVAVAYTAAEALATQAKEATQVALVDIRLGRSNGVELVRELHRLDPALIAVMMTAYASVDTAIEALQAGAYDYLCKPFYTQDLTATLARCFERLELQAERMKAEERLRQAQRIEAIGQLAGGVAHDFNNLLAVILGNLRLIEDEVGPRPALRELVEDAINATRSGVELTSRLLAFGRAPPLNPESSDLGELVRSVSRLLDRTLGQEIAISLALAADLRRVRVDRVQFEASLINLTVNARDAMPDGGKLSIEARNVVVPLAGADDDLSLVPGEYVALFVVDSGRGMTPAVLERAIEPFFTTKPPDQGSGLGLSMVHSFASQSGGALTMASTPGRGTRVTLHLPVADAPLVDGAGGEEVALAAGEHVLLVEDQPKVRLVLKRQLLRLGYEVIEAEGAEAALTRLREGGHVDLLLTDVLLPGPTNGVALGAAALSLRPELGIVLMTGHASERLLARSGPIAEAIVLRKPVDRDTLARALRSALQSSASGGTNI
ncbi:His Kinase A (phospho-acceptor) domain-containing protein [Rhizobiales bacterium GAS191]|nr:His Kinase A (phospho-acceptor) domain-containing protein [Rhizobiales bacterium GAS191]